MPTAGSPTAPPRALDRRTLAALAAGLLALAVLAILAWSATRPAAPPAPVAPPALDRMMRHVSVVAAQPRPIGTAANARAREYIVEQLRAIGLRPQVQTTTVQKSSIRFWGGTGVTLGVVHNIGVRLPGRAPAGGTARPPYTAASWPAYWAVACTAYSAASWPAVPTATRSQSGRP